MHAGWGAVLKDWRFTGIYAGLLALIVYRSVGWLMHGTPGRPDFEAFVRSAWQGPFFGSLLNLGRLGYGPFRHKFPGGGGIPEGLQHVVFAASVVAVILGVTGGVLGLVEIRLRPDRARVVRVGLWLLTVCITFAAVALSRKARLEGYS